MAMTVKNPGSKRRRILPYLFSTLVIAYLATWFLGVPSVMECHYREAFRAFQEDRAFYEKHKNDSDLGFGFRQRMQAEKTFQTREEFVRWSRWRNHYYAILPFFIVAMRSEQGATWDEYHIWYILGSRELFTVLKIIS